MKQKLHYKNLEAKNKFLNAKMNELAIRNSQLLYENSKLKLEIFNLQKLCERSVKVERLEKRDRKEQPGLLTGNDSKEGSIDTQDNPSPGSSRNSSTRSSISSFQRKNSKYSLNTDAGRKNILVLCLLVVCLVGNFNENRSHLAKSSILKTDLDQILNGNRLKLMEALEMANGDLTVGVNDLNPDYMELTEEAPDLGKRPNSIVKMNGLVPFVAKNLPLDKSQEDTLYELCMKYANVNKQCSCRCPDSLESIQPIRTRPIKRFSKYLNEKIDSGAGPSLENLTLSRHVKNTKALEPYQSLPNIIEETASSEEIQIFDTEEAPKQLAGPQNSKAIIEFVAEDPVTLSLDNFAEIKVNSGFKLPEKNVEIGSRISDFFTKQPVERSREQFMYKCHLHENKENSKANQFNLVLGKSSFDKLTARATYSAREFLAL